MDAHLALYSGTRSQELRLPHQLAERLMTDRGGPASWIEDAIAPFKVYFQPTPDGTRIEGEAVAVALTKSILEHMVDALDTNPRADTATLKAAIDTSIENDLKHELTFRLTGLPHPVRPMSLNQVAYMQSLLLRERTLVIGMGPTGTGKTHLAAAAAVNQLGLEQVKYIVATCPHVIMEGEVVTAKTRLDVDYDDQLNALGDIFRDLLGYEEFNRLCQNKTIEILPLGRMRGRTFNDAFIIIDEAQNMSARKMRMAATRIGNGSRMVITGDPDRIELQEHQQSGLIDLLDLLQGSNLAFIHKFTRRQIIRNQIVAQLEELYENRRSGGTMRAA